MASGTIYGTTSNEYIDAKIEWSSATDNANNRSTVTAALYYKRTNTGFVTFGTCTTSITINGVTKSVTQELSITSGSWVKAIENTVTVAHNNDGSKSIVISATGSIAGTTLASTSVSGTAKLNNIPRASIISYAASTTLGTACDIRWTPKSTSFRYKLKFVLGNWSITTGAIHPNTTGIFTYKSYTIPLDVANQIPNTRTGTMEAILYTYYDTNATVQVGDEYGASFSVTVPDNTSTKPTVSMSLTPSSSPSAFAGLYIQGLSKVKATLSAQGKYGASIASYKMSVLGKDYGSPYISDYITTEGDIVVTATIVDSRGFSSTYSKTITFLGYSNPKILPTSGESDIVVARCGANGILSDRGNYLRIKAKRSYAKVISEGVQKNFCSIRYRYKPEGGAYSSWKTILNESSGSDEVDTGALLGSLDLSTSYLVQVQSIDTIGNAATTNASIPTEKIYWHRAGSIRSFGFGEYVEEENLFSIARDIRFRAKGGFDPIEIPELTDFDTITTPNNYYARYTYVPSYVNCPISVQTTFSLEVIALGKDGQLLQRVTRCSADGTVYERQYYSNKWHEWECVNPPMDLGVEYRTTERYMGKPVYTQLIYCETLPNATYKLFTHGIEGVTQAIRCVGQMSDGNSLPFRFSATNHVDIYAGKEYVVIYAGNDKSKMNAYAQIWYIKD